MLNRSHKIFLYSVILFALISVQLEKYFPEFVSYKTSVEKRFKDFEAELAKLDSMFRLYDQELLKNQSIKFLLISYPFITEFVEWSSRDSFSSLSVSTNEEELSLKEISRTGTSKLIWLKEKLYFAVPKKDKIILIGIRESDLKSVRKENVEYFYPDLLSINPSRSSLDLKSIFRYSISRNFHYDKFIFSIANKKYDLYFGSPEKKRLGFLKEFLFLKESGGFYNFYFVIVSILLLFAFTDGLFHLKGVILNQKKESILESDISENLQDALVGNLQKSSQFTVSSQKEKTQAENLDSLSEAKTKPIFILPFELMAKTEREITLSPGYLRKVREEEKLKKESILSSVKTTRDKIFTPDLERLIGKVGKDTPEDENKLDQYFDEIFLKLFPDENGELYKELNELYDHEYHEYESLGYLKRISAEVGLDSLCISIYNRSMGCYMVSLALGLDENTRTNLVFQWNDPFLVIDKNDEMIDIFFTHKLMTNLFFRKKFSPETLAKFGGILVYPLRKYSVDGYFILFYEKNAHITEEKKQSISGCLDKMLIPFMPIINGIAKEKIYLQIPDEDILAKIFQEMKEVTNAGLESCLFINCTFENLSVVSRSKEIKNDIIQSVKEMLRSGERILSVSPVSFLVILKETKFDDLRKRVDEVNQNQLSLNFSQKKYPDENKNFYSYL